MSSTPKLTKRQKKGIAFRGRTRKLNNLEHDVPILEVQDLAESRTSSGENGKVVQVSEGNTGGKGKERKEVLVGEKKRLVEGTKKRKREAAEEAEGEEEQLGKRNVKRRKGAAREILEEGEDGEGKIEKSKQRFILFLGNLKYTTTIQAIQAHFAACDPPPFVRLLAPKPVANKPSSKPAIKSKGCAFLEFNHRNALQQGLKLHHSKLDGRQINIELTAGGGGKSEARLSKLRERNKELETQRRKTLQKKTKSHGEELVSDAQGGKRCSTTSGVDQEVHKRRTWTIGDVQESTTHRGGKKHAKGIKAPQSKIKDWSTGVNAIPVG